MRKDPPARDDSASANQTFTLGAQQAILDAQELAHAGDSANIESVHLLLGALQIEPPDAKLGALLQISGLKAEEVRLYAQALLERAEPLAAETLPVLSEWAKRTLQLAGKEARRDNCEIVDVAHIFVACFNSRSAPELAEVLAPLGVSAGQLSLHLRQIARVEATESAQKESPLAQLTAHGERALDAAHAAMRAQFCGRISTLHLLIGVLENPESDAVAALQTLMIDVAELKQRAAVAAASDGLIAGPNRLFTPVAKRALDRAKAAAREGGRSHIGSADLLMGLLQQPAILIERAQFGARPDDPAATITRDVDADLVRAIFNPRDAATAPTPVVQPRKKISGIPFWLPFGIQIMLGISMQNAVGGSSRTRVQATAILLLIVLGGLGAATAQLNAKAVRFKTPSLLFFAGALLGAMAAMYLAR